MMKKCFTILCCTGAVLFTACKKEDVADNPHKNYYSSGWQQFSSWKNTDSAGYRVYYTDQVNKAITSDVINNGVVVTYSKLTTTDPEYLMFTKPVRLPFYFLPPQERAANSFYWYDINSEGRIRISYRIKTKEDLSSASSLQNFQFSYFLIPKAFLDSKKLSVNEVKYHYTYRQLAALLGVDD